MGERERNEQGRYTETITPKRVLDTLRDADEPFMATGDVADALGCSNEAARLKLNQLQDEGTVERRNVRGAVVVWWLPEDGEVAHER
ncbi:response regulator of citrate/malate metabolism [Halobacteriales archaeon QS_8_65_32]|jgi:predicted ArsR family transcriptional regulator|nr:MAG: response regulator of citrate/malate metabolism [Halobacteriales archaeon QS_8_65_32]